MARTFKDEEFAKRARKGRITDISLLKAVEEAENGLIDADLGGGVIKKRVARQGAGKSSGFRTVIAFESGERAFFIHLFAKNDRANIDQQELADLKEYAGILFAMTEDDIDEALAAGALEEIE